MARPTLLEFLASLPVEALSTLNRMDFEDFDLEKLTLDVWMTMADLRARPTSLKGTEADCRCHVRCPLRSGKSRVATTFSMLFLDNSQWLFCSLNSL